MRWLKKISKLLAIFIGVFVLFIIVLIARFFIVNDAPVLNGEVIRNVEYKPGLKLDIYKPTNQAYEKSPVVLYFHGGAWVMGNKFMVNFNRFNTAINNLRNKGYAIVAPNYSLANDSITPFPAAIYDARDAIKWLIENSEEYDFDRQNIGILAESAGAHIAMMAIYTKVCCELNKNDTLNLINYFIDAYAPVELTELYAAGAIDSMQQAIKKFPKFMQKRMDFTKHLFDFDPSENGKQTFEYLRRYSPYYYANSGLSPTLIIHGLNDKVVPPEQSLLLKQRLDSLQVENEILLLEGVSHVLRGANDEQHDSIQSRIVEFIEKNYKF